MHSPHDSSSGLNGARRQPQAGIGVWLIAGFSWMVALGLAQAPTWAHVLGIGVCVQGYWLSCVWRLSTGNFVVEAPAEAPSPSAASLARSAEPVATGPQLTPLNTAALTQETAAPEPEPVRDVEQDMLRYALSHDLRAPLRVVDGFIRIVKEDYGRHLDRLGHDHLDRVLAASARMNSMIDAVLAQAQIAGAVLVREDIDLSALAREVGTELLAVQGPAGTVHLHIADGLTAQADPLLLRRVLENLLGNALKYSAKVAEPRVALGCMPATNPSVYYVRDNGAGFDMRHADKLFGMFQRLHSAKDFPGTGVGLAGVSNIVRRHGGRVWAEAESGQGACFYFTLMGSVEAQRNPLHP
jgi:signal transduction histidine kinase